MIDHVNIPVRHLARARAFYEPVLDAFGYRFLLQEGPVIGFGDTNWVFGLAETEAEFVPLHLAFSARSKDQVHDFHRAALANGGTCNGAPGPRKLYGPDYYAGYVIDPDGHNIEAVKRG
ncbi:VOC family protein [Ruegeria sp. 2205SS24-7]|uniref:VOC family protein n=1 Tax=Ruegeria discodermiae TaxID=3064389 RepID=UPI0027405F52|nr:VOC family protein [Ruegeria sp. 2205SS24-7]MDP5219598.1 VOC family protein [Ruegeria sp. 2205SS24-7]